MSKSQRVGKGIKGSRRHVYFSSTYFVVAAGKNKQMKQKGYVYPTCCAECYCVAFPQIVAVPLNRLLTNLYGALAHLLHSNDFFGGVSICSRMHLLSVKSGASLKKTILRLATDAGTDSL